MRRRLVAALLLGLSAGATLAAPKIDVSVTPTEVTLGDRIEMVVTVEADPATDSASVRFQSWDKSLGLAEIVDVGPVEQLRGEGSRVIFRQRLALTLFQLGEITLPPVEAVVSDASGETPLTSASSRVVVRSVLPEGAETLEAKPPAPPERPGLGDAFWWSVAALLATCVVAVVALWRQSSEAEDGVPGRPRLAPMEELRRSLAALRNESGVEPIHAGISLAVRRFLGRVVGFQGAESTTTEVRRELRGRNLAPDLLRQTHELLSACDLVMFARRDVPLETARERIGDARTIADEVLAAYRTEEAVPDGVEGEAA